MTVPQAEVLDTVRAWYHAIVTGDRDVADAAGRQLFEAARTLELTEALAQVARANGVDLKVREVDTTLRLVEGGRR